MPNDQTTELCMSYARYDIIFLVKDREFGFVFIVNYAKYFMLDRVQHYLSFGTLSYQAFYRTG